MFPFKAYICDSVSDIINRNNRKKGNGMDIIGAIKFRVEKVSSDNRQKNILSLLYILWFLIWAIVFINISANIFINTIGRTIFLLINSFVESIKKI